MYLELIGKTIANLWSLETILRLTLLKKERSNFTDVSEMKVGQKQEENYITKYFNLENLIKKYNSLQENEIHCLDQKRIIDIRDLLAHGRVEIKDIHNSDDWILYKFSKKDKNNELTLQEKVYINKDNGEWLKESLKFIAEQMHKVKEL